MNITELSIDTGVLENFETTEFISDELLDLPHVTEVQYYGTFVVTIKLPYDNMTFNAIEQLVNRLNVEIADVFKRWGVI